MDSAKTLTQFKEKLKAPFAFVPDPDGKLVKLFDVKLPVVSFAKRYTFVIGAHRRILKIETGADAIDPNGAIVACPLHRETAAGH